MSSRPRHVCFYSKKCPYSKAFLEELAKTPYTREFQFVCVDPAPNRPKLPTWLKGVPTLLIDGESDPLTDEKVFNWLSMKRIQSTTPASKSTTFTEPPRPEVYARQEPRYAAPQEPRYAAPQEQAAPATRSMPEPVQTRSSPNQAAPQVQQQTDGGEPMAYHSAEMAGSGKWSDAYSYLDDQFSIEKGTGTNRIERNFAVIDDGRGGTAAPVQQTKESEKARALHSAYDDFKKNRDADLPGPIARR